MLVRGERWARVRRPGHEAIEEIDGRRRRRCLPADLVSGDPSLGGDALGNASGIAGHVGAKGMSAGGGRGSMGAMVICISGRVKLNGPVDVGVADGGIRVMAFGKGAGADELIVTEGGREVRSSLVGAVLAGGDRVEVAVREALMFRLDACVEDADNEIQAVVKVRSKTNLGAEFEELEERMVWGRRW